MISRQVWVVEEWTTAYFLEQEENVSNYILSDPGTI